jgi:gluconolactonase
VSLQTASAAFSVHDPAFEAVLGERPRLELVVETEAHEGPCYSSEEDALYFTTPPGRGPDGAPRVDIRRLALDGERFPVEPDSVSPVREDANAANGMTLDAEGRLVVCEQGSRSRPAALARVDRTTGSAETLVDGVQGARLNSPNDVIVRGDGSIWFTDPSYGFLQGFRPEPQVPDRVYRHEPERGELAVVADGFDKPNGLAFSPDERVLYVGDSGANQEPGSHHPDRPHHIEAFDVVEGPRLENRRRLAVIDPGFPDGIKVDSAGRIYSSSASGVQVFGPGGEPLGEIRLPGAVNFTFGGPGRNVLYITADDAIWAAVLGACGPATAKGG